LLCLQIYNLRFNEGSCLKRKKNELVRSSNKILKFYIKEKRKKTSSKETEDLIKKTISGMKENCTLILPAKMHFSFEF